MEEDRRKGQMMSEKIQSVDVEAIMAEIREKIKERGYTQEMLSFDEAVADADIQNGVSGENMIYSEGELNQFIHFARASHNIPYYEPIPGNKLKVFIKRVIRKIMAFQMLPLRERQNHFNYYTIQCIRLLDARIGELEDVLTQKEELIEELEMHIQELENK